jgi:hypothetical protein
METLFSDKEPLETPETNENPKLTWQQWLGTDEAVRWVYLIFGFCAIVLLMVMLQFSTKAICCGDWDGYYHIRWSSLLWENFKHFKWLPEFKWLPLTVLNANAYADHHFLFHLLQIPFLWFFEPVTAAKVATVFYGSLAIFAVYWLIFRYKIDYLLIWLGALLTCANPFFYRMNMAKAPPLTIIITIAGIYLLFERKYIWLFPLMFVFVWTYSLFPLLLFAAIIWTAIIAWNERKVEWQPLAYTFGGMVLGNIINPYFPANLGLFFEHFWTKFKVGDFEVPVGGEWYAYSGIELLTHFPVALIAMLIGYVLFAPKNGKMPEKSTFFLGFVTILLVSQFRSKRFAEYFPPFAILFAAFSWKEFITPLVIQLPDYFKRDIEPLLDAAKDSVESANIKIFKQIALGFIGVVLVAILFFNFRGFESLGQTGLISDIKNNEAADKYENAMRWANENIPEGERFFNCNWDDFPKMFFYDQKHSYVYGLDPNYLYSKNPELYKQISDITGGKIDDPAPIIRDQFGAKWIFTDAKENTDFVAKALESGWCETVYEDSDAQILKIRDAKGEVPNESVDEDSNKDIESQLTPEEKKKLDEETANDEKNINVDDDDDEN